MKKTDKFTKAIAVVMFAAVACYLFGWLWRSTHTNIVTAPVEAVSISDSAQADGIAVREETLLDSDKQYVSIQAQDGKSVASGAVLANATDSKTDLETMNHIEELKLEISSLQTVLAGAGSSEADVAARDGDIRASVLSLSGSVARGDLTGVSAAAMDLSAFVFKQDSTEDSQARLQTLQAELSELESGADTSDTVTAPAAGIFSWSTDGYEELGPDSVQNLTVSKLDAMLGAAQPVKDNVFGKLVTSEKWYFAAKVDYEHASQLTAGKQTKLLFPRYYGDVIAARVESVSAPENGVCAVVFSTERALADTLNMRKATAQVVFSETQGLRVPLKAVHVDQDVGTYVYCLTAQLVEKKYVSIIKTEGDYYIVSVDENADALREGNTLIVSGTNIYEGRVIDP